jgi:signal transduction histidine kinase/CheY-like chemotaxis protein
MRRLVHLMRGILGPKLNDVIGLDERVSHVRAATAIGIVVGLLFSIFNIVTEGMLALGLTELAAVVFLLGPAAALSRTPERVIWAESLLLLSALVIFGALIVFGGIEGTGLFWVYTAPFLAFFLKGQRQGWWYSLGFTALVTLYFWGARTFLPFAYPYSSVVTTHFLMSLGFYTLVAAAFNHVRSRFEEQLQQRKEQAEAAYLAKSRFLAAASHDLRQPAHALGMFVARLAQLPNERPTQELITGVDASVRALQDMLDAFFDYSRLDAKSMHVRQCAFPLDGVFEQLNNSFAGAAAGKGLRLRIRPSPAWLQTDPILLHRILLNLVSNAVQHTPRGSVLVSCRPTHGLTHARIEVWDSGIGIAAQHHQKIFEEFFQVENPERDRSKGLGLGLSIVERSCKLLGHPLVMRSSLGCGTRFTLRVPLAPAQAIDTAAAAADTSMKNEFESLHILLIEDDALGSAAVEGLLASWGCQVSVAGDAQMACDLLRHGPTPDFIVSDYRLRGLHHGVDAIRLLRQLSGQQIAACVISGDTDENVRQQTQAAGLVLLQKPVRPAKLRSLLRHFAQARIAHTDEPEAPSH